ncbi:hypothetical protein [Nitratireductor rhodophyticola]|uniref:hypothetical protein n=1 Tax=Nitratireductor rhodophyticola TaxID=2854036 RepID=UPI00300A4335
MSPLLVPALLSVLIAAIHIVVGGRDEVPPLLRSAELPPVVKFTHFYCWHLVSVTLVGMAGSFLYAAYASDGRILAILATIQAGTFCLWGLALVLWKRQRHRDLPQWALFAGVTATGAWALTV